MNELFMNKLLQHQTTDGKTWTSVRGISLDIHDVLNKGNKKREDDESCIFFS